MKISAYLVLLVISALTAPAQAAPWRAQDALGLPAWLSLEGTFRARYETLAPQYRASHTGSDQVFVTRTTLKAGIHYGEFSLAGEMIDSRAALDDNGSFLNTTVVNPVELLQGYVQWRPRELLLAGDESDIRVGRFTMDVGSRRFVARNRFRNTVNAFTGIDWQWHAADGRELRAFFTLPVSREPTTFAALRDNDIEFDEEDTDVKFWGLVAAAVWREHDHVEVFYFGLDEDDSSIRQTRNRDLSTIGVRLYRGPRAGHVDYEFETAFQFGESRSSTAATNTRDLDHFAHFHHAEVGYSFSASWQPRLAAQYDYASGDDNPADRDYERYSTLYGARRFDFGPTGIYGPFARENLNTPGLRVEVQPAAQLSGFLAWRGYWLASDRDAWTTAGIVDPSGRTGSFIGHQAEMAVRYDVAPGNVRLEGGFAHLFAGDFMDEAPNSRRQGDVTYAYTQIVLTF
jgi:hypothetical protein